VLQFKYIRMKQYYILSIHAHGEKNKEYVSLDLMYQSLYVSVVGSEMQSIARKSEIHAFRSG
jgi:hypothetical protein